VGAPSRSAKIKAVNGTTAKSGIQSRQVAHCIPKIIRPHGYLALKLLFTLSLIGVGATLLVRLMRPGHHGRKLFAFLFLPFLIVVCTGVASVVFGQPMALIAIPLFKHSA